MKTTQAVVVILVIGLVSWGVSKYVSLKNSYVSLQSDYKVVCARVSGTTVVEQPKTVTKTQVKYVDMSQERVQEIARQYQMKIDDLNAIIRTLRQETTVVTETGGKTTISTPVSPGTQTEGERVKPLIIAPGINKNARFTCFLGYKWVGLSGDTDGNFAGHLIMRF